MRLALPPKPVCDEIDGAFHDFFVEPAAHAREFRVALEAWAEFYHLKRPPVRWRRRLIQDWSAEGLCWPDGTIDLIHPRNWPGTETEWMESLYHELGHYLLWADAEKKADMYARRWMEGM